MIDHNADGSQRGEGMRIARGDVKASFLDENNRLTKEQQTDLVRVIFENLVASFPDKVRNRTNQTYTGAGQCEPYYFAYSYHFKSLTLDVVITDTAQQAQAQDTVPIQ